METPLVLLISIRRTKPLRGRLCKNSFLAKVTYPSIWINQDILSLVDRVESPYNFLCYTVGMSWRKSKSKEVVLWES